MSCYDLDVLRTIVKIEGKLTNLTPLRIGKGKSVDLEESTDNPIVKLNGKPVIPGSSLKGAFRSFIEAYYRGLDDPKFNRVCDLDAKEDECPSCTNDSYCIPCILFGFKDLSARVYVLDAVAESFSIGQRTMVAINRVFGGQYPKALYTLDYVEPGAKFSFTMFVYNLDLVNGETEEWKKEAVKAMKYLFRALTGEGLFLGAKKSAGFGLVKLTEGKLTLYKRPDIFTPKTYDLAKVLGG